MNAWRATARVSIFLGFLTIALILATPIVHPESVFKWKPFLSLLIPLLTIMCMLALRPRLSHSHFSIILFSSLFIFLGLAAFRYVRMPILGITLVALAGLFAASAGSSRGSAQS